MENPIETSIYRGFIVGVVIENNMQKTIERDMETGSWSFCT